MAKLPRPKDNRNPFTDLIGDGLAPAGTHVAKIVNIKDGFGIERQKYQSTEMETVDLTWFLFGFRDGQEGKHLVSSKAMKISGSEKSALFEFLKSLLGKAPEYGVDYCALKGTEVLLTVEHVQRRDGSGDYAAIATISPLPPGMETPAPVSPPPPEPPASQVQQTMNTILEPSSNQDQDDPIPF